MIILYKSLKTATTLITKPISRIERKNGNKPKKKNIADGVFTNSICYLDHFIASTITMISTHNEILYSGFRISLSDKHIKLFNNKHELLLMLC